MSSSSESPLKLEFCWLQLLGFGFVRFMVWDMECLNSEPLNPKP